MNEITDIAAYKLTPLYLKFGAEESFATSISVRSLFSATTVTLFCQYSNYKKWLPGQLNFFHFKMHSSLVMKYFI